MIDLNKLPSSTEKKGGCEKRVPVKWQKGEKERLKNGAMKGGGRGKKGVTRGGIEPSD